MWYNNNMNKINPRWLDIVVVNCCGNLKHISCDCSFDYRLVSKCKEGGFRNYFSPVGGLTGYFGQKIVNRFSRKWFSLLAKIIFEHIIILYRRYSSMIRNKFYKIF